MIHRIRLLELRQQARDDLSWLSAEQRDLLATHLLTLLYVRRATLSVQWWEATLELLAQAAPSVAAQLSGSVREAELIIKGERRRERPA